MNIFVLDLNPIICAQYHTDKHVVKMILETAQLLSTAVRQFGMSYGYSSIHEEHPCTKWVGISAGNLLWLKQLGLELCQEYTFRYGRVHKSELIIRDLPVPESIAPLLNLSPHPQCMPKDCRGPDPVQAYRKYYLTHKRHLLSYTKRTIPNWIAAEGLGVQK